MELVERGRELRHIEDAMQRAISGSGGTTVIEGDAGVGKTSLLDAAADLGMRVVRSQGGELEQDLPFSIVRQLFEPVLKAGSPAFRAEILADAAGLASPLLYPVGLASGTASSTEAMVHGLYWVCSNLAEHAPLFIVIDDAHWIDESSLRFVSHLARRLADMRAVLVLATRPRRWSVALHRALSGVNASVLQLNPLSDQAIANLVRQEFGPGAAVEFCQACAEVTGGNPFLLTEALIALRAGGVDADRAAATQVRRLSSETITRSVLTRLARHGTAAELLAQAVAVLGPDAAVHRVVELAGIPARDAAVAIDELQRDSILAQAEPPQFIHPLVRSTVYEECPKLRRAIDHKRVVTMLQSERVALSRLVPHLLGAERANDPQLVDILIAAADDALTAGSPEVAVQCLDRALVEPADADRQRVIHRLMGYALAFANRIEDGEHALRTALELTPEPLARSEIATDLGWLLITTGQGGTAKMVLAQAIDDLPEEYTAQRRRLKAITGGAALVALDNAETWRADPGASWNFDGVPDVVDRILMATAAFGAAVSGSPNAEVVADVAAAAARGEAPPRERWLIVTCTGLALALSGREAEAVAVAAGAIEASHREGDIAAYRYMCVIRSHFWYYAGNLLEAEADARGPVELVHEQDVGALTITAWTLINVLVERGQLDEAEQALVEQGLDGEFPVVAAYVNFALHARARLRKAQGRLPEALKDLLAVGDSLVAAAHTNPAYMHWRSDTVEVYLALGRDAEARALAKEEVELARQFGAPRAIGVSLRALGLTMTGHSQVEALREAVAVLTASTAELECARALVDLGIALRHNGKREESLDCLRRGMDLATQCRGDALAERARAELIVAGARPRRDRITGPSALTASEHRVASLASTGLSNREIAQRLFVSRRTVELHLTNTFRKLGIETRQDLSRALDG